MGSGTTNLAARELERNSAGYEINEEFIEFAKNKLGIDQPDIYDTEYEFFEDELTNDPADLIESFKYKFTDYHKFDKKVDPKKLQYGSKIDKNSGKREDYFTVKEVINHELVRLNNNMVIRLIGVKEKENGNGNAIEFLINKIKGQQVYLKYDERKYDENNHLMCYLYLKNRTFINAHLIKKGYALPDTSMDYRLKDKFLKLAE